MAQELTVANISTTRTTDKMVQFNAEINGILIRDFKYFVEKGNLLPPARQYEKDGKRQYWVYTPFSADQRNVIITALKAVLK